MTKLSSRPPTPPVAERKASSQTVHATTLVDEYAWLRAGNWQQVLRDPTLLPGDIRKHLERENRYAASMLAGSRALRGRLLREMKARIDPTHRDPPAPFGPFAYYSRFRKHGEHGLHCRRPRDGGPEQVLLDADALASGTPFFALHGIEPSPDHRLLAWSLDDKGSEVCIVKVRDIATGEDLPDTVGEAEGHVVWTRDSRAFLYVRLDSQLRPSRVFLHRLGEAQEADRLVFSEPDPGWFVTLRASRSGAFAIISIKDHDASENHLFDLSAPDSTPQLVAPRQPGLRYEVDHRDASLVIRTNADGAEDFKLVEAPLADPAPENWRDLVPHRRGRMITGFVLFATHVAWLARENGLVHIDILDLASKAMQRIEFPEEAYALAFGEMHEFATGTLRFRYSSMTTPEETYDYDMVARERRLVARTRVPSGHDPANYVTRRIYAPAPDGESVPITLLFRKGLPNDGTAPLLLNGYGAYGFAREASFVPERMTLVDRGYIYAIAHVRGGADKGWHWYEQGKLAAKRNTFGDFIAVARHLIDRRYTSAGRIVAQGGSAGGMLMGVIANEAPALFGAVIADVPFVDVLNTMLDATLPLTPPEWLEWGNPIADRAAFERIEDFCPYQNVAAKPYPPILALAGLTDPRVTYWEPAKWIARLRAANPGAGPFLLHTNMAAGHAGASGRYARLKEVALDYAFAIAALEKGWADAARRRAAQASPS